MPPWQGGGAMIDQVTFAHTSYAPPPARFEAGTPHIIGAIGLHAAIDYVEGIGMDLMIEHENALVRLARERLSRINSVRLFGPEDDDRKSVVEGKRVAVGVELGGRRIIKKK